MLLKKLHEEGILPRLWETQTYKLSSWDFHASSQNKPTTYATSDCSVLHILKPPYWSCPCQFIHHVVSVLKCLSNKNRLLEHFVSSFNILHSHGTPLISSGTLDQGNLPLTVAIQHSLETWKISPTRSFMFHVFQPNDQIYMTHTMRELDLCLSLCCLFRKHLLQHWDGGHIVRPEHSLSFPVRASIHIHVCVMQHGI